MRVQLTNAPLRRATLCAVLLVAVSLATGCGANATQSVTAGPVATAEPATVSTQAFQATPTPIADEVEGQAVDGSTVEPIAAATSPPATASAEPSQPSPAPTSERSTEDDPLAVLAGSIAENRTTDPGTFSTVPSLACVPGSTSSTHVAQPSLVDSKMEHVFCVPSSDIWLIEVWNPSGELFSTDYALGLSTARFSLLDPRGTYTFRLVSRSGSTSEGEIKVGPPPAISLAADETDTTPHLVIGGYNPEQLAITLHASAPDPSTGDVVHFALASVDLDDSGITSVAIETDMNEFCVYPGLDAEPLRFGEIACFGSADPATQRTIYQSDLDLRLQDAAGSTELQAIGSVEVGVTKKFVLYATSLFDSDVEPVGLVIFASERLGGDLVALELEEVFRVKDDDLASAYAAGCKWVRENRDLLDGACAPPARLSFESELYVDPRPQVFDFETFNFDKPLELHLGLEPDWSALLQDDGLAAFVFEGD